MTLQNGTGGVTHPERLVAGEFVEASPIREGEILSDGPRVGDAWEDISDDDLTPSPVSGEESKPSRTFIPRGKTTLPTSTKGTGGGGSKKDDKKDEKKGSKKENKKDNKKDNKKTTT